MHEIKHEWHLASEALRIRDEEFYVSWLHGAWKSRDCQEQSLQPQYLCEFSSGQPMLAT